MIFDFTDNILYLHIEYAKEKSFFEQVMFTLDNAAL